MIKLYPLLALTPLLVLSGCSSSGSNVDPLRGIAASVLKGQAYDRAYLAARRGDVGGLQRGSEDIRRAENVLANRQANHVNAESLASDGSFYLSAAQGRQGAEKDELMVLADAKFRAAIDRVPSDGGLKALEPNTLNSIGYYLADQGKTLEDWKRAVTYTKAAYDRWPVPEGLAGAQARLNRAMLAQDSYAWALFKLGRFQEALVQAEDAVKTMRSINPASISAEIVFHMAEIYRVVGEIDKARGEYETALQLSPTAELRQQILDGIKALEYKQV